MLRLACSIPVPFPYLDAGQSFDVTAPKEAALVLSLCWLSVCPAAADTPICPLLLFSTNVALCPDARVFVFLLGRRRCSRWPRLCRSELGLDNFRVLVQKPQAVSK